MKKINSKMFLTWVVLLLTTIHVNGQLSYKAGNALNHSTQWSNIDTLGSDISFSSYDDENSSPVDIGFNFIFNGQSYNKFVINTNGFIKLDSFAPSAANLYYNGGQSTSGGVFNSSATEDSCILAVFNTDLDAGTDTPKIRVYTFGKSGSRICIIQWKNFKDKHNTPGTQYDNMTFQIKLYEGSNRIDYVYGPFTPSSNSDDRFTVAVGIRGADATNQNLVSVTKASTTSWDQAVIQAGNYTSGFGGTTTHNTRRSVAPDSGRTYTFMPVFARDLAIKPIYSYGKVPKYFTKDQTIGASITNNGFDTVSNFYILLNIHGANQHADTHYVSQTLNPGDVYTFTFDKLYNPSNLGNDTFDFSIDDDNSFNNYTWYQTVSSLEYSYADWSKPSNGGFSFSGFGATGDVLTKFYSAKSGIINKVKLSFTTNNINCKVGIWDVDTNTGLPGTLLYINTGNIKTGSNVSVSIPNIAVGKEFFIGVRQQSGFGSGAIGLAYQTESPVRDSTFYSTTPSNSSNWNDFSNTNTYNRLMVEADYLLPINLKLNKLTSPASDTCTGGRKLPINYLINNIGSDTIDFSKDSVSLYATVTYPNGNTINYGPTYITSGKLNPGDSNIYTATSQLDMSDSGWYQISGYFSFTNDMDHSNDSLPMVYRASSGANSVAIALGKTNLCTGDTLTMNAASSKLALSYLWYKDGTPINTATDTIYRTTQAGEYYVETTNSLGCTGVSDTITVVVNPKPSYSLNNSASNFCPGDSVLLTASSKDTNYSYVWYYNNNVINNATDSMLYIKLGGDYHVQVSNKLTGCTSVSAQLTINQYAYPDTNVFVTKSIICTGDSIKISASNNQTNTLEWLYNGSTIQNATDSFIYASNTGTYHVIVTSSDGCKATNSGLYIYVDSIPNAVAYSTNGLTSFCDKDSLQLEAYVYSGNTFQWYNTSGAISGAVNSNYYAMSTDDYSVEVTNSNGCKAVSSVVGVTKKSLPTPALKTLSNTSFCNGDSLMLEISYNNSNTYQWLFNGNDIQGKTDTILYVSTSGNYTVRETMNGCSDTAVGTSINALPLPNPQISASGNTTICEGELLVLKVSASLSLSSIQWNRNGNAISGAVLDSLIIDSAGDYTVNVTSTNGCSEVSSVTTVTINPKPQPAITNGGSSKLCSGDSVQLSLSGSYATVQWKNNGNNISGANNNALYVNSAGDYTVEVSSTNGCFAISNKISITVNPLLTPVLSKSSNANLCTGDSIALDLSTNSNPASLSWEKDGNILSGITTNKYYAKTSGSYLVKTVSSDGCKESSNTISLTFNPLPSSVITYTKPVLSVPSASGNIYQWYKGGVAISGATNNTYTALTNGNYSVEVTNSFGCKSTSAVYNVTDLGIFNTINTNSLNIYPNPTNGIITVDLQSYSSEVLTLQVMDINGKILKQEKLNIGIGLYELNLKNEQAGIYIISILGDHSKAISRIIKQ